MMKQWHIKAFSELAKVSVRTLHHYDKIDLLKPSLRADNNYRLYSEEDLLRLQQIIALKFFGFKLSQIKKLLAAQENVLQNLVMQASYLQEKSEALLEASQILKQVTNDCRINKSIPWQNIIQLIEVYQMAQQLEDSWVKDIFTKEELAEYAEFEAQIKSRNKQQFEQIWSSLVEEVKNNLHHHPYSEMGINLGKRWMEWVNNLYGKKYAHLRTKKFEKGFGEGLGLDQHGLTPEIISWVEQALDAFWRHRLYHVLGYAGKISSKELLQQWNEIMDDMYGEEEERKIAIAKMAFDDEKVNAKAKVWLKKTFNL